jgi:hypothetical protein
MKTGALLLALIGVAAAAAAAPRETPVVATQLEAKPKGPIAVDVRLAAPPALGSPLTVTVTARADGIDRLVLEVRADDPAGLAIGAVSAPVDRAGARTWSVIVVPVRSSGANLSIVVAGEIDGVAQAQSVVTPVRPAGAAPPVRAMAVGPSTRDGENLTLLPVEELPGP